MALRILRRTDGPCPTRPGPIVPRKITKLAVFRNAFKRAAREAVRQAVRDGLLSGSDIVIQLPGVPQADLDVLAQALDSRAVKPLRPPRALDKTKPPK